ncbi:hypothetical protein GJ496_001552 [Pomphorhynchus laevis]|nr:hypothetical protein GJ496_001552 [Pomphorhynchus laevis]
MDASVSGSQRTVAKVEDDDHIDDVIDLYENLRKNNSRSNVNQDAAQNGDGDDAENLIKPHLSSSRKRRQNGHLWNIRTEMLNKGIYYKLEIQSYFYKQLKVIEIIIIKLEIYCENQISLCFVMSRDHMSSSIFD